MLYIQLKNINVKCFFQKAFKKWFGVIEKAPKRQWQARPNQMFSARERTKALPKVIAITVWWPVAVGDWGRR